jgi:hypothetical protein
MGRIESDRVSRRGPPKAGIRTTGGQEEDNVDRILTKLGFNNRHPGSGLGGRSEPADHDP